MTGNLDPRTAGARRLENKVCIVTGSGQGIGRATAKPLGEDISNQQAIKRSGLPEEQALTIVFMAPGDASLITGQIINRSPILGEF